MQLVSGIRENAQKVSARGGDQDSRGYRHSGHPERYRV